MPSTKKLTLGLSGVQETGPKKDVAGKHSQGQDYQAYPACCQILTSEMATLSETADCARRAADNDGLVTDQPSARCGLTVRWLVVDCQEPREFAELSLRRAAVKQPSLRLSCGACLLDFRNPGTAGPVRESTAWPCRRAANLPADGEGPK